jgi:hypothetical protein
VPDQTDHDILIELQNDVKWIKEKLPVIDDLRDWKFKTAGAMGAGVLVLEALIHIWGH